MAALSPVNSEESAGEGKICALCLRQFAKYSCPRCNILYCSLSCYQDKNHSQCSESFYKDNIVAELQQRDVSDEDRAKMLEMLQRLEEEDTPLTDEADSTTASLEERLSGLDLDGDSDKIWERLTAAEREQFMSMAQGGALTQLLSTEQTPWWEMADTLVTPLDDKARQTSLPQLPPSLPSLPSLVKSGSVSPDLCYDVINVLYGYTYVVRMYNMSHRELPVYACQTLLDISSCLSRGTSFKNVEDALHDAMTMTRQNPSIFNSDSFSAAVLQDVQFVLNSPRSGRCLVPLALSDTHKLLGLARSELRGGKNRDVKDAAAKETGRQLSLVKKKVHFYLVWASTPENASRCRELSIVVKLEHEGELAKLQSKANKPDMVPSGAQRTAVGRDRTSGERKGSKHSKLIQELD